jgi:hypothetical protein
MASMRNSRCGSAPVPPNNLAQAPTEHHMFPADGRTDPRGTFHQRLRDSLPRAGSAVLDPRSDPRSAEYRQARKKQISVWRPNWPVYRAVRRTCWSLPREPEIVNMIGEHRPGWHTIMRD